MNEEFYKWLRTKNIDEYSLTHGLNKDDWEWQLAQAAFLAGAAAMQKRYAEVAEFKATIQPGCCGIATCPGVAEARQEAAREILEWAAGPESYDEWVVMVRERFGLEG